MKRCFLILTFGFRMFFNTFSFSLFLCCKAFRNCSALTLFQLGIDNLLFPNHPAITVLVGDLGWFSLWLGERMYKSTIYRLIFTVFEFSALFSIKSVFGGKTPMAFSNQQNL